jgi:hypothetical protein
MPNVLLVGAGDVGTFVPVHLYVYGGTPPETFAVQVTDCPTDTVAGDGVQVAMMAEEFSIHKSNEVVLPSGLPVTVIG